jgi:hypothetical protein
MKCEKLIRGWGKLHNEELHDLYVLTSAHKKIKVKQSQRVPVN